jgi:hypothetical protein
MARATMSVTCAPIAVDGLAELGVFAEYVRLLGGGGRHIGEAATLAWAEVHRTVALIDDGDAVQVGRSRKCEIRRTLALVIDGIQRAVMSADEGSRLIDDLVRVGGARFPCDGPSFIAWAEDKGLIVRGSRPTRRSCSRAISQSAPRTGATSPASSRTCSLPWPTPRAAPPRSSPRRPPGPRARSSGSASVPPSASGGGKRTTRL